MTVRAVISDIHGNLPALTAVLEYLDDLGYVDEIVCLGDIVGYGAWPKECLDIIMERTTWCLCGNHDVALLSQAFGFNRLAKDAIDWQRTILRPSHWFAFANKRRWTYLEQLYDRRTEQQFDDLYVHASPRDPVMEYVEETDCVDMGFGPSEKIMQIMSFVKKICFVGHSHRPGIVTADYKWIHPHELPEADETGNGGIYEIPEGSRALVNIGSLGQPRDEDPRSCIVTYDLKRTVQFHRVPYDVDAMVEGVKNVPQLDIRLGERLRLGR